MAVGNGHFAMLGNFTSYDVLCCNVVNIGMGHAEHE